MENNKSDVIHFISILSKNQYTLNNLTEFLIKYCIDRGKNAEIAKKFVGRFFDIRMLSMIQYAVEWYRVQYDIRLLQKPDKEGNLITIKVL